MVRVLDTTFVAKVTGEDSPNRTGSRFGINGTDLGIMWDSGGGEVFVIFGDTYGEGWGGDGPGPADADWRRNVLACSTTSELDDGLSLDGVIARQDGFARQVIPSGSAREETVIPNAGITVDGTHYVHYMSVRNWGPGQGEWRTNHAGIAVSRDGGGSWRKPPAARWRNGWPGHNRFQLGTFARSGEHVYLLGTTNGRYGSVYLARTLPENLPDVDGFEYWTGNKWSRAQRSAAPVASGNAGELSVAYNDYLGQWLLMHLDERREGIVLRSAESLTGPFSTGEVVMSGRDHPALYGGFIHPWRLAGPQLYYTVSQWRPYNVFLMRSTIRAGGR